MNIGSFDKDYKKRDDTTPNKLIDEALQEKKRENWRKAAHKEYAGTENIWESIEGEDLENPLMLGISHHQKPRPADYPLNK